ncbi:MAG: class I SAM-dependent methyltransferase [Lachnospiraceae bacterium]|nr:class I SAM-dependent methyltransferase [Lachnospiraceae bacterium]
MDQNQVINYYEDHAEQYASATKNVDLSETQNKFLSLIPEGGRILDFGCGSGRDTKYFLEKGYKVDAVDGCKKLCELASEHCGIEVKHMMFDELSERGVYDGIWACASVLHLKKEDILDVLFKMLIALKINGYIYMSFKYGDFDGVRDNKHYTDFTEESFRMFFNEFYCDYFGGNITVFSESYDSYKPILKEQWKTVDTLPDRGDLVWLNLIIQKVPD